jgi:hypothetical protein
MPFLGEIGIVGDAVVYQLVKHLPGSALCYASFRPPIALSNKMK